MIHDQEKFGLDREKIQVFLFTCPANIPFSFGSHNWFVINKQGSISRWEILFSKRKKQGVISWGHLFLNCLSPFQGIGIFPFSKKKFSKGKLLKKIEGDTAKQMAEFIENSHKTYPYYDKYFLTGPNSNTYVQWVLNNFPECKINLSWNSFGKGYPLKKLAIKSNS